MNSKDLKAMAYDVMANIEYLKKKLSEINESIAKAVKEEKEEEENKN